MAFSSPPSFTEACDAARRRVEWDARTTKPSSTTTTLAFQKQPQVLRFQAAYRKNLVSHTCTMEISLTKRVRGWSITGNGSYSHKGRPGRFHIVEGLVSEPSSSRQFCKFYWIEQHSNHRQYVAKGKFSGNLTTFRSYKLAEHSGKEYCCEGVCEKVLPLNMSLLSYIPPVPTILVTQVTRRQTDGPLGIAFDMNEAGQVVVSNLRPGTLLGEQAPNLAVGMPVARINHQPIYNQHDAAQLLRDSSDLITLVTYCDEESSEQAVPMDHLVSTSVFKETVDVKTGFTFVYDQASFGLYLGGIKKGSLSETTGLKAGMRVWAINECTHFTSNQAAANAVRSKQGWITLVASRDGHCSAVPVTVPPIGTPIAAPIMVEAIPSPQAAVVSVNIPDGNNDQVIPMVHATIVAEPGLVEDVPSSTVSLGAWC